MKTYDLGSKPSMPLATDPEEAGEKEHEPIYPELRIDDHDDVAIMGLPDEGSAVVKFKVTHRAESLRDGKKKHSVTLAVHSIEPHKTKAKRQKLAGPDDDMRAVDEGLE